MCLAAGALGPGPIHHAQGGISWWGIRRGLNAGLNAAGGSMGGDEVARARGAGPGVPPSRLLSNPRLLSTQRLLKRLVLCPRRTPFGGALLCGKASPALMELHFAPAGRPKRAALALLALKFPRSISARRSATQALRPPHLGTLFLTLRAMRFSPGAALVAPVASACLIQRIKPSLLGAAQGLADPLMWVAVADPHREVGFQGEELPASCLRQRGGQARRCAGGTWMGRGPEPRRGGCFAGGCLGSGPGD